MTPQSMIADLDASLARRGSDAWLLRSVNGTDKQVKIRTRIDTFQLNESPLAPGVTKVPKKAIFSLTQIQAAQSSGDWPAVDPSPTDPVYAVDPAIPIKGDRIVSNGEEKTIVSVNAIAVDNIIVRVEAMVEG